MTVIVHAALGAVPTTAGGVRYEDTRVREARRIPLLPWVQIPQAVISFHGEASVHELADVPADVPRVLLRGLALHGNEELMIRIRPAGQFLTYGVGVSLMIMRNPEAASGRASV